MMMIDKLAYSSPWRNKSASLKCILAAGTLCICVAVRSFVISGIVLAFMAGVTVTHSQASFSRYGKMMLWPFAFLIMGTAAVLLDVTEQPDGILQIALGSRYLIITEASLNAAARLVLVSLAAVSCLYFLVLTTPVPDLLFVLRKLHCPHLILELMLLIYRAIFLLLDLALSIRCAQNCRLGNRDFKTTIRSMGSMLAALLVQAVSRSSRMFSAMEARCYDGEFQVLWETGKASKTEIMAVITYLLLLLVLALWCYGKGGAGWHWL